MGDTSLATASAVERCAVLVSIMAAITRAPDSDPANTDTEVAADKLVKFSNSVAEEEKQLKSLKNVLGTQVSLIAILMPIYHNDTSSGYVTCLLQGTLRPIFESQLKQKRLVRNRAMNLRRTMAEAGLDYEATEAALKDGHIRTKLEASSAPAEDIEEIVKLVEDHFKLGRNKYFFVDVSHFFFFLNNFLT